MFKVKHMCLLQNNMQGRMEWGSEIGDGIDLTRLIKG